MVNDLLESSLRRVPWETIFLGFISGLGTGLFLEPVSGGLVLAGSLLAALSFLTLKSFINKYLTYGRQRLLPRAILIYLFRVILICLIFLIIIFLFRSKVLAFAAGFSLLIISLLIEALRNLASGRQWKV